LPNGSASKYLSADSGVGKKLSAADAEPEISPGKQKGPRKGDTDAAAGSASQPTGGQENGGPAFVFDSKPASVNLPEHPKSRKRPRGEAGRLIWEDDNLPEPPVGKRKKLKTSSRKNSGASSNNTGTPSGPTTPTHIETEDITAEVEARLRAKEERRQKKEKAEKKRKRESMNSNPDESSTSTRKSKKRKSKKSDGESGLESSKRDKNDDGRSERKEKRQRAEL
jgi:hypothetical protein